MIQSKSDLKFYLFADRFIRYSGKKTSFISRLYARDYILDYLISMRWVAYYTNCIGKKRFLSLTYLYHSRRFRKLGMKLGFSIGYNSLGYGAVIPHYGTIVVNGNARLGNYCVLHTSTCIAEGGKIGDGLYLSTGSILVCPYLGDYVTIGANSLVRQSENESYSLIAGSPAVVIKKNYPKWFDRDGWSEKVNHIEFYKNKYYS